MWPTAVNWEKLRFGVEIEFVGGKSSEIPLLAGWNMAFDEKQIDETGLPSGSELQSPPLHWEERGQIREMLSRLSGSGAKANWSCGTHVHVDLENWGIDMIVPLLESALSCQQALMAIFQTTEHRLLFCPPVVPEMRESFIAHRERRTLCHRGRPQSHRCGINTAAWFDNGTVEIRYANGSLDFDEIVKTIELCLRYTAAVGTGRKLGTSATQVAAELEAPLYGYPKAEPAPRWYLQQQHLEDLLIPIFAPLVSSLIADGEIHTITPEHDGLLVLVVKPDGKLVRCIAEPSSTNWKLRSIEELRLTDIQLRIL